MHINFIIALLAGAGLEDVLVNVARAGDRELLLDILHLAYDIQRISEGKYGLEFAMKVESEMGEISMVKQFVQNPI
ncbi:MAG: hypothetical protein MUD14_21860 [Hydrococcus sp. Prado102]|jgi:hypothetical protein|nr:hypothetical protein [Hydrococcus sp. Prado102]